MKKQDMIDRLLEEVVRGQEPRHVLEQHTRAVQDHIQKEQDVVESLLAMYADLTAEDANLFDNHMNKYYEDEQYSLTMAVTDLLQAKTSQFFNNRLGEIVKRHKFNLNPLQ